jgi:DNA polymerase III epsilon subunit-like protein
MNYYILDTETTGLKSPAGVVEFSARLICGDTLRELEHTTSLCNPGLPIEPGAQAIHGISEASVADAPKIEDVFKLQGPTVAIAHNWAYDSRFLSQHIDHLAGSLCTLVLARKLVTDSANHKLGTLAAHLGLEVGTAHRAAGDTQTTLNLLRYLVEKSGRNLQQLVEAAKKPQIIHTMSFGKYKGQAISSLPRWYIDWFLNLPDIDKDLRLSLTNELKTR